MQALRSNLLLLVLTVVICCGLYPLVLYGFGKAFFPRMRPAASSGATGRTPGRGPAGRG